MFIEERVNRLEERVVGLESHDSSSIKAEIEPRLNNLEERDQQVQYFTQQTETRLNDLEAFATSDNTAAFEQRLGEINYRESLLEQQLHTLKEKVAAFEELSLETRLELLDSTDSNTIHALGELRSRLDEINHGFESLSQQCDEVFQQLAETEIGALAEHLENLGQELSQARQHFDSLDHRLHLMDQRGRSNEERGRSNEERCRLVEERMQLVQEGFSRLEEMAGELHDRFENLHKHTHQLESRIGHLEGPVWELHGRVESVEERYRQNSELTKKTLHKHTLLHQDVDALALRCGDLEARDFSEQFHAMQDRLAATTASQFQLVERLAQQVSQLQSDNEELTRKLNELSQQVNEFGHRRPLTPMYDRIARICAVSAIFLALFLGMWSWMGSGDKPIITAQKFRLVDPEGTLQGEWGTDENGGRFSLRHVNGGERFALAMTDYGPKMAMSDGDGKARLKLDVSAMGPEITLASNRLTPKVRIAESGGENGVSVYDERGKLRAGLGMSSDGSALNLFDERETRRVILSSNRSGPALGFLGDNGVQRTTIGMTENGESLFNLHDSLGRQRIVMDVSSKNASLSVLDPDTNLLFSAP